MEIIGSGFLARHLDAIAMAHPDVTVLAAGAPLPHNPPSAYEREVRLVEDTIAHCRRSDRKLVFLSTAASGLYGGPGCRGEEDAPIVPTSGYGRHKLALEQMVGTAGIRYLSLRLTYIVGPHGRDDRLVPALIHQLRSGQVTVYRGARRDILDVADFVVMVDRLLAAGAGQQVVNIASGESVPVGLIVDHLEQRLGLRAERTHVDVDAPHWVSVDKLRRLMPDFDAMGFGPGYYRRVIDRYLAATAEPAQPR